ncbi:MAG: YceD family protein [Synechocystis sp.]|nr:YceD family protein [Synechocystis sp.]
MQPLYIPHLLKQPHSSQTLQFDEMIGEMDTLTPVRGQITVRHGGTFLEVIGQAETIVTLTCDRCTQCYNHRLIVNAKELLWLDRQNEESLPAERELSWDDLSETLPPDGHFDVKNWLYEQLSLALPLQNRCDQDCQPPSLPEPETPLAIDRRWAALADLKQQLS